MEGRWRGIIGPGVVWIKDDPGYGLGGQGLEGGHDRGDVADVVQRDPPQPARKRRPTEEAEPSDEDPAGGAWGRPPLRGSRPQRPRMATSATAAKHRHTSADCRIRVPDQEDTMTTSEAARGLGRVGRVADGDADVVGAGLRRRAAEHSGCGVDGETRRRPGRRPDIGAMPPAADRVAE